MLVQQHETVQGCSEQEQCRDVHGCHHKGLNFRGLCNAQALHLTDELALRMGLMMSWLGIC